MADIFISYSHADSAQATQLAELLGSAGLSCWIDQSGIEAATSWSAEIVDAIDGCKVFVVMLSPNSVASHNVVKEVSLASERQKNILPLDLEPVELPKILQYALAGLQRTSMSNIDAIIRALGKLSLEATGAPQAPKIVRESDGKKTLMILPFEDISPSMDNGWFADGIVSELISALSKIKSLRMKDAAITREYKSFKGHLTTYATEMSIRYFVQGDVRKFGDSIKITARLLDIESGEYLWQDSLRGEMKDIFDIQEAVAKRVVEGLTLHLSSVEKKALAERETENAEAYELLLKASESFYRATKEGMQLSVQLCTSAITLDPGYAKAYMYKASALAGLYGRYDLTPALLVEAESLCKEALRLSPDLLEVYSTLCRVYALRGEVEEAEELAKEYIRRAPENFMSHFCLGIVFAMVGDNSNAIAPFEESVRLKPDDRPALFNLVNVCHGAMEIEKCSIYALRSLPLFESHLKLHPDDEGTRVSYAVLLFLAGRIDDARREASALRNALDGSILFNLACVFGMLGDTQEALATIRNAIEAGYRGVRLLKQFMTDEAEGVALVSSTAEYEVVKRMVEKLEAEREATKTSG